jgi:hypothetical protein
MSTVVVKNPVNLDRQIRQAKAILRELKSTLEDLEDARDFLIAKKRNAGKPGTPLRVAAKDLGLLQP